jgi:hypothetical protein
VLSRLLVRRLVWRVAPGVGDVFHGIRYRCTPALPCATLRYPLEPWQLVVHSPKQKTGEFGFAPVMSRNFKDEYNGKSNWILTNRITSTDYDLVQNSIGDVSRYLSIFPLPCLGFRDPLVTLALLCPPCPCPRVHSVFPISRIFICHLSLINQNVRLLCLITSNCTQANSAYEYIVIKRCDILIGARTFWKSVALRSPTKQASFACNRRRTTLKKTFGQ